MDKIIKLFLYYVTSLIKYYQKFLLLDKTSKVIVVIKNIIKLLVKYILQNTSNIPTTHLNILTSNYLFQ